MSKAQQKLELRVPTEYSEPARNQVKRCPSDSTKASFLSVMVRRAKEMISLEGTHIAVPESLTAAVRLSLFKL